MTENAPHFDDVKSELEDKSGIYRVHRVNGNTIRFVTSEKTYGPIVMPKYENWYVTNFTTYPESPVRVTIGYIA